VEAELSTLSLQELSDMLTERGAGQDAFRLINVHLPHTNDILGTDADVPFDDIDELMATVGDPGTKAVVYCQTGALSDVAGHSLVDEGYCNLFDLPDGYGDWEDEGFDMAE
jgi:rhodanese-related sulfurtransferase